MGVGSWVLGVGSWVLGVGTENRKLKTNNRVPSCKKKSYHPSQGNSGRSKTRPLNSIVLVFRFAPNRASNRPTDILHKNGIAIYRIIRINAEQVRPSPFSARISLLWYRKWRQAVLFSNCQKIYGRAYLSWAKTIPDV